MGSMKCLTSVSIFDARLLPLRSIAWPVCVCFITAGPITKLFTWGDSGRRVEDMCYERRRAEACVDESAHHALVNAGGRENV
jgi:hypothetical protein